MTQNHRMLGETNARASLKNPDVLSIIACPICKGATTITGETVVCTSAACGASFPIIAGVPILINDRNSVFTIAEFRQHQATTFDRGRPLVEAADPLWRRAVRAINRKSPTLSLATGDFSANAALAQISAEIERPRILVIGCGDSAFDPGAGTIVYTDVAEGQLVELICDANDLPFRDESFDAVLSTAVLSYVTDPVRSVAEIARVLRAGGFVYDVCPFMQQVVMGRYDFTRFTYLGHRRLFRHFTEIRSGMANGPAMTLAWSLSYFLSSFFTDLGLRKLVRSLARWIFFPVKYFDYFLIHRAGAYDGASGFYFFGRKSPTVLSDRELLSFHRGLNPK
jgi:SAM-dependent methyltransferase